MSLGGGGGQGRSDYGPGTSGGEWGGIFLPLLSYGSRSDDDQTAAMIGYFCGQTTATVLLTCPPL